MADGHCFISYSTIDGLEFARKLANKLEGGTPGIPVWFDKDDLKAGREWDIQIDEALKSCRMVLFVMTKDSTHEKSVCRQEWSRALSFKKAIIPLWVQNDIDVPFRLQDRQRIDFRDDFDRGLAQLRDYLEWLDSPEGILQGYKDRLLDAERDLRRANDADKLRIEADIDELKKQIEAQEKVAENPEAAKRLTEQNIQNGLERERKPQLPVASFQSSKFINQPPGVAQNYFQDRLMETEQAILFLKNEAQRVLTVVGRGGAGKTAMTCRLLKHIENGGLPDDYDKKHGRVDVDGIVYLSEAGSRKVNFANLFDDLCKLLPAASAEKLSALYREPQTSTESKTVQLLAAFQGLKQVIVLLDNFENVVDAEKGQVKDAELDEALRAFLHAPHHPVKIIITTRVSVRELDTFEPARQRLLPLDTGLQPKYAREAFILMDEGNLVGIKNAGDELLNLAVTRTLGLPRALEALYAALRTDRFTTLQELLDLPILPDQVVQAYVGEAFNRLDTNAQKVMQALAVYNRPVTPAAVDYLLAPYIPAIDSAPILQRLANMHFARKESGRFYLHYVDREYTFGLISKIFPLNIQEGKSQRLNFDTISSPFFTQEALIKRAASFFKRVRKPSSEWKNLDDINAQLAEFELRCAVNEYDIAAFLLSEIDFDCLILWGHYSLMIDLHLQLKGKIVDPYLRMGSLNGLGFSHYGLGKLKEAIYFYSEGLKIAREIDDIQAEGVLLGNLASVYANLGDVYKSIEFYEQALEIANKVSDSRNKGVWLSGLGIRYADLGDVNQSIEFYTQALSIRHKVQDRRGEAVDIENLGQAHLCFEEYQKAEKSFDLSLKIANEISLEPMKQYARCGMAKSYLFQNKLPEARTVIEIALHYAVPQNNHNASTLHGIIALRQGDEVAARGAFVRAIGQADEILSKTAEYYSALDAKGLAVAGLLVIGNWRLAGERDKLRAEAIEIFRKARKIAPHAGVVKSVLRLFDELAKCDIEGILKDVRKAVEGA